VQVIEHYAFPAVDAEPVGNAPAGRSEPHGAVDFRSGVRYSSEVLIYQRFVSANPYPTQGLFAADSLYGVHGPVDFLSSPVKLAIFSGPAVSSSTVDSIRRIGHGRNT
jgi:hypothetical protein